MCTPRFTPHATPSTAAPQVLGTGDERPADFSYHEYLRTSKFCVSAYGHGWGACCPLRAPAIAGALPAVRCALGACTWHSNDGPLQAALGSAPQGVWRGGFRMAWLCMAPVPARQHLLRTLCTGGHAPPPPARAGIRTVQIMLNGCVPVIVQVRSQHAPARTASACAISLPCAGLVLQACWSCWAGSAGSQSNHRKGVLSRGSPSPCLLQEHVIQSHEEVLPYEAFSIR